MRNAGLEETQAGIKIARRNINNLTYVLNSIHQWIKSGIISGRDLYKINTHQNIMVEEN